MLAASTGSARAEPPKASDGGPRTSTGIIPLPVPAEATPSSASALAVKPPSASEAALEGSPILGAEVILEDNRWNDPTPPPPRVAGESFSAVVARRGLRELLATGQFANGRVSAFAEEGGVRVAYHMTPRKLIARLRVLLRGADLDSDDFVRAGALSQGGEVTGAQLEAAQTDLRTYAIRHGYPEAEVTVVTAATGDRHRADVTVDLTPGPARLVGQRVFYVTGEGHAQPITREDSTDGASQKLFATVRGYTVSDGQRTDEPTLGLADRALERSLRSSGYFSAAVSHDLIRSDGRVVLRVRVDAGPRVLVRFEGNEAYDGSALESALDLGTEDDRSTSHLAQKIHDFYASRGFLDTEVTSRMANSQDDRFAYLFFHVTEHPRVHVQSRSYPCLRPAEIARLSGAPSSARALGREIDSFLEDELPGEDILVPPDPSALDATIGGAPTPQVAPMTLDPDATYFPSTYDSAATHLQELYRQAGFLAAQVGPVQVIRRRCAARSPAGQCIPVAPSAKIPDACTYDTSNLPLPVAPLDTALRCTPDPAHGIECAPSIDLRIPVKLGPRTSLYDLAFTGVRSIPQTELSNAAQLPLGVPVNLLTLDDARRRLLDYYKEAGFVFADASYVLEYSTDRTRARIRFDVREGEQVLVDHVEVRGAKDTELATTLRRVALVPGEPYRTSLVRLTQQNLATLGVFGSIDVHLADPYIPARRKTVIIDVTERARQYIEVRPGFSTGEGLRLAFEYSHRNLGGKAIALNFRAQASYLPTPLILDPTVRANWKTLGDPGLAFDKRIASRVTLGLVFPEIGLGPRFRAGIDGVFLHDLQRDFFITKIALIPSITYRPIRQLQVVLSQSIEDNYVHIFTGTAEQYLTENAGNIDLLKLLNYPAYASGASAQRVVLTWDRRDNAFDAHRGTYSVTGVEHVDDLPLSLPVDPEKNQFAGHFLRLTQTLAGYIPLPKGIRIAAEVRIGANVQLTPTSQTYPDRLFFMGGPDSMRGWLPSSFLPQDDLDKIKRTAQLPDLVPCGTNGAPCGQGTPSGTLVSNPNKFTPGNDPIRGGNLMFNPRIEVRIPVRPPLETVVFLDSGNLWRDASYPFDAGKFPLRVSVGTGIRVQTPVGPLALDYGINLTRHAAYEDFGDIHFAIGLY